jgi:uncharacterized repeat protein (TIGR03803 family)
LVTAAALPAQSFTTLFNFFGGATNGSNPVAPLIQSIDGNLYGTTQQGGPNCFDYGPNGCGTVFKMTPGGTLTTLYYFCALANCTDGAGPNGLVQAGDGVFYGTTINGGAAGGWGTVFQITAAGKLTTLYTFCASGTCTDGGGPSGLVQGANGDFYGTTDNGGAHGMGSVFKFSRSGGLTTLYSFCALANCVDGSDPKSGVVQGAGGNFYGTTNEGGAYGWGSVFGIAPDGALTTLYSFCASTPPSSSTYNCPDGSSPNGLAAVSNGDFYGTTYNGGSDNTCYYGCGTVFQITPGGALATLHSFVMTDGANPFSQLVQGTDEDFFGTTIEGGANSHGTVFRIRPNGTLTTLHSFAGTDGSNPEGLVQDTNGSFYGTTDSGGTAVYDGTAFRLSVGLGAFVKTLPTAGEAGAAVKILGTNLTGATGVSFNGAAAVFTVISSSEISTTVPAGATSGGVQVTTPGGTFASNTAFHVLQ